jgi:hypothetical protein
LTLSVAVFVDCGEVYRMSHRRALLSGSVWVQIVAGRNVIDGPRTRAID